MPNVRSYEGELRERLRIVKASRDRTENIRDIGEPPDIADPKRRAECKHDLKQFLITYFPSTFYRAFSADHDYLINCTKAVLKEGGQFVCAMPRGSGKTSIFQRSIIWALLYGHRKFPLVLCADDEAFKRIVGGIRVVLETDAMLFADFPEICHPIVALGRAATRAPSQMCCGIPTYIQWSPEKIVFPFTQWTIERGNAGCSIAGGGLQGSRIRGQVLALPNGEQRRVDAVLVDDPQTRRSAQSPSMTQQREDITKGDAMGCGAPGQDVAMIVAGTVIEEDDYMERLLDRDRSPMFVPMRVSMVKSWPTNRDLWDEYHNRRVQELKGEIKKGSSQNFYASNRQAMDEGALVYWEERKQEDDLSALQSAMNEYYRDPRSFMAEYQNTPAAALDSEFRMLKASELTKRIHPYTEYQVPDDVVLITAHIDVQLRLLYYMVCGWSRSFRGYILGYGTTPGQTSKHFTYNSENTRTLEMLYPGNDQLGAIRQGLMETMTAISDQRFEQADGTLLNLSLGFVDCRYHPEVVEEAIIISRLTGWDPAWGVGIGAKDNPLRNRESMKGLFGNHWVYHRPKDRRLTGYFVDTNYWKNQAYEALSVPATHSQAITLYEERPSNHQLLANHLTSERAVRVEAKGRRIDEWELPGKRDNHWWDNLVGNLAAASARGIKKPTEEALAKPKKRFIRRARPIKF